MPYGPHTTADRERMLAALGLDSVDDLFADIPADLRASALELPDPEPELELAARLREMAGRNRTDLVSFLGAGVYRHWSPPAVDQLLLRGEWYTAYTPYQPEVSQGTLQSIYEYESLIGELVDLDVVSASHYDGAAATAEAALMTCRATRRERVLVSRGVHPHYRATLRTYFGGGLELDEIPLVADGDAAGTTDLGCARADAGRAGPAGRRRHRREPRLPRAPRADAADRRARPRSGRAVRGRHRARVARRSWRRRAPTAPTSPQARVSRSASRRSTAARIWGSSPPPTPSSARSPAASSG